MQGGVDVGVGPQFLRESKTGWGVNVGDVLGTYAAAPRVFAFSKHFYNGDDEYN